MSDPFPNFARGDPLNLKAETLNGWNLAGRFARQQLATTSSERQLDDGRRMEVVRVENQTGDIVAPGACLKLGDPAVLPTLNAATFATKINFQGTTPAAITDLFAVTIDPIRAGGIGLGVVAGAVYVEINVGVEAHRFATPYPGQNGYMQSAYSGPARILWKESGTGIKRAYVLIGAVSVGESWTWTATKTTDYAAAIGEAVTCDVSTAGFTVTLPDWATSPTGSIVLISCIAYTLAGGHFVSAAPTGSDKINGLAATQVCADRGVNVGSDVNAGGDWRFIRSPDSAQGWSCNRYLST